MDGRKLKIGRCIYCGATGKGLSREHVIPYGVNGELVLHEASCASCSQITSRFEQGVLKRMLGSARAALGFRSRRKKMRPTVLPIQIDRGWGWETKEVDALDFPAAIILPVLAPPTHITGDRLGPGVEMNIQGFDTAVFAHRMPRTHPLQISKEIGVRASMQYDPLDFARMVAKIGYGVAIAEHGVDAFAEVYILPLILGTEKDAGTWVGSTTELPKNRLPLLHSVTIAQTGSELYAFVKLFAAFGGSEYVVVLGRV